MKRTVQFAAVVLTAATGTLSAQAPDGSANRSAMERMAFMIGVWRGDAWMQSGPERVQTRMVERVEPRLEGTVLLVEGQGVVDGAAGADARTVHHALAVISFDPQSGTYGLRSYIGTGQSGDFRVSVAPGIVKWSREVPGGRIRYTATIGNGEWHEIGEFSRDGTSWSPIMEMKLRREP